MQEEQGKKIKLGFIGQGWIGKNYADYYEENGFDVVRYSNELSFRQNKDAIKTCDIVFVSVPTPTTPSGFDYSIVEEVLSLVGDMKVAIIKSTLLPGTTSNLQKMYRNIKIVHSPEFLSEKTARFDIENPDCNILGLPMVNEEYLKISEKIKNILPKVPTIVCTSDEAELIKYTHNIHGFVEILYSNMMYDLSSKLGTQWEKVKEFMMYDKYMTDRYASPVHASGHTTKLGRGAGGHCFIKDFSAFSGFFKDRVNDVGWQAIIDSLEKKNIELLKNSGKDEDILKEVYGSKN